MTMMIKEPWAKLRRSSLAPTRGGVDPKNGNTITAISRDTSNGMSFGKTTS